MAVLKDLDQCEKLVGQWDPTNNFSNVYNMVDYLQAQIEEFNNTSEGPSATPTNSDSVSSLIPPTPGGQRRMKFLQKAKDFNKDLQALQNKFKNIQDVAYDKQKVDLVFDMTQKSIEQSRHLKVIIERLLVLERMNKESPNIEAQMQEIIRTAQKTIPEMLVKERTEVEEVRDKIIGAATELD